MANRTARRTYSLALAVGIGLMVTLVFWSPMTVAEASEATNTGTFGDVGDDTVTIAASIGTAPVGAAPATFSSRGLAALHWGQNPSHRAVV